MNRRRRLLRCLCMIICILFSVCAIAAPASAVTYHTSSDYDSSIYYERLCDVELTGDPRVDLINVALSQFGYSESSHYWQLDGMNIGIGNYTEYGNWYGVQSLWCAMFVSWCAHNAGIPENVIPSHAYTPSGILWFMDRDQVYTRAEVEQGIYTPQAGDLIYFKSDRNQNIVNHVGIVLGYFNEYVYTIEGNINFDPNCTDGGQVLLRSRHISDVNVRYFCCPNYSSDVTHEIGSFYPAYTPPVPQEPAEIDLTDTDYIAVTQDSSSDASSQRPQYRFIP